MAEKRATGRQGEKAPGEDDGRSEGAAAGVVAAPRLASGGRRPGLKAYDVAQSALREVAERTGKRPVGVMKIQPLDDSWTVEVEVIDDRRVPSSADLLALYEMSFARDGHLISCRRVRRYPRRRDGNGQGPVS
jgi:hypothetical protein